MFAVIMAGGKGTRFWPLSRESRPKHLLDITGEGTIIRQTVERIKPLVPAERILVVTGASHAAEVARQLPEIPTRNIIVEPVGRNTAPCIGLAAHHVQSLAGDEVMVVLPSDQRIGDEESFREVVMAAAQAARGDHLVTIGITPTGPETGYGYLQQGELAFEIGGRRIYRVRSIREKPSRKLAEEFIRQGGFFWNSGMFVWRSSTILEAIAAFLPGVHAGLARIREALATPKEAVLLDEVYPRLESIPIDYGVMEKAGNVLLVPGDFDWSDLGSWDTLWEVSSKDRTGNACSGQVVAVESRNCLVRCQGKLAALVGVDDLIVVETKDALLVCKRGMSQEVRQVVQELERRGAKEYL